MMPSQANGNPAPLFPDEAARCESCGYPLNGLPLDVDCPECGHAITDSHPDLRTGPAWHHRQNPISWCRTAIAIIFRPNKTFTRMNLGGSNRAARLFLAVVALLAFTVTATLLLTQSRFSPIFAWGLAMLGTKMVIAMTYVEAMGVTFFSRRHGWPLGLRRAERVACYASVGWLPAVAIMALAADWLRFGNLPVAGRLGISSSVPALRWVISLVVFCLSLLGFETLVWIGARRIRFGNAKAS